ncbi:MAG: hypothetical protein FWG43_01700 [Clostridiales bacterium]|nr:hypothetical protein [Clostridiales bacterium]
MANDDNTTEAAVETQGGKGKGKKGKAPKVKKEKQPKVKKAKKAPAAEAEETAEAAGDLAKDTGKKKLKLPFGAKTPKQKPIKGQAAKAKKVKIPKSPPPSKRKQPKGKQEKNSAKAKQGRRGFPLLALLLALLIALALVAYAAYYFDLFQARTKLLNSANNALASLSPEYRDGNSLLTEREKALDSREAELDQREQEIQKKEDAASKEDERLNQRASALDSRESIIKQSAQDEQGEQTAIPLYRQEISDEKMEELENLGKIYSRMDTEAAAKALSLLNGSIEMAEVLYYMDKKAASALLDQLEPELTAQITREMLRK